jgi:hypothetical protein
MESFEALVGKAILAPNEEARSKAESQLAVKMAVCSAMMCRCGAILDQRTASYFELHIAGCKERPLIVCCPACRKKLDAEGALAKTVVYMRKQQETDPRERKIIIHTWKGSEELK